MDNDKIKQMDEILNFLYSLSSNYEVNKDTVYSALCYYNLKDSEKININGITYLKGISNEDMFPFWLDNFKNAVNTRAVHSPYWPSYLQFISKKRPQQDEYIKLYIPIDYNHLYNGVNELFSYIDSLNIQHESKVSKAVRVDNVIVRLPKNDIENAKKIIDFINSNDYLKEGLNKVNPFIPTIDNIGIMEEHGNSYNYDLSCYIAEFIKQNRRANNPSINANQFRNYLKICQAHNFRFDGEHEDFDNSLLNTFEQAYTGSKIYYKNNEPENTLQAEAPVNKKTLFYNAIEYTYQKYGMTQVKVALYQIINFDNYQYISNGPLSYRNKLVKNLPRQKILYYIDDYLTQFNKPNNLELNSKINAFCELYFSNNLAYKFEEICNVTLNNYNKEQLKIAITKFQKDNNPNGFSRYSNGDKSVNYRDRLKYFDNESIYRCMLNILLIKGYDINNLNPDEIIDIYIDELEKERESVNSMKV